MAILQISKIQQRSGNLVDLPQLDEAEFGWANDAKRLFIGKTTPNENIEILTSYSQISFSQLDGSVGNLNINPVNIADGQLLVYSGSDWVNRGGDAGGLITLGDVSNVKIEGGATGYVLQTDGSGNLSWTPKGTIAANVLNVTKANPAVVTTVTENFFEDGAQITFINPQGMTQLAGNIYYANLLTATTFELYTDSNLSSGVNSSSYNAYAYTTVSGTTVGSNTITVANSAAFTANSAVQFVGDMSTSGIVANTTYYVLGSPPTGTTIKIATSPDSNASNTVPLQTTSGLTAKVYQSDGQAIATIGSTVSFSVAGGANTQVQYNGPAGALTGSSSFTFDYGANILTLGGNANVGNLNSSGVVVSPILISNVSTGVAPPLTVSSTDRVANLNVSYANVSDFQVVTAQTTGTYFPVFVSSSSTGNRALGTNANISFNAATGNLSVTLLNVSSNANVGNIGATTAVFTTGNITTINSGLLQNGNSNIAITSNGNITLTAKSNATVVITDTGANITGTANISGNANVGNLGTAGLILATGNITGGNINTGGVVAATGNVSGGNLTTAGALSVTGNANVGNLGTATAIITTGNITTINSGLLQNGNSNVTITANGNVTISAVGGARFTATSTGANVTGILGVSGNANVGNIGATNGVFTNVSGNGSALTSITGANVTGTVANATYAVSAGSATTAGTVTTNAQPNITSVGTLSSLAVTGNVTAGNVYANSGTIGASLLTGTLTTAAQPNVTSVGTLTSLTISGNANISGNINFTGAKANLGSNANLTLTGGTSGQLLSTDGSGNLSWVSQGAIIGGAAGSNTQVQYNALGLLAASANFTFNYATNALAVGGNITSSNLVATSYHIRSIATGISAAGTTQGTATALTKEINVVSTVASGAGVVLPTAVAGMVLIVNNTNANTLNVYPATGGVVNSGSTNAAYSHPAGASIQYYATSGTQWYTVGATFA